MSNAEKEIVDAYAEVLRNLSVEGKQALIKQLSSPESSKEEKDERFYSSFGSWVSEKSAEEIIEDLRASRHFREKDLQF